MATRAIVTSQPDVACDMCGRRLLRGEQPEMFLAGAERRTVCELCAPRAAYEGWMRETEAAASLSLRPSRRRGRGVSLLGRLRQLREPSPRHPGRGARRIANAPDLARDALEAADPRENALESADLLDEAPGGTVDEAWSRQTVRFDISDGQPPVARDAVLDAARPGSGGPQGASEEEIERVLDVFNAGEHPRRIGGVARSLGDPAVTVRRSEQGASRYTIVVAWELCWYRYEIDLEEPAAGARLLEKGMELDELPSEDKLPNAAANERGELGLVA
jgi:hypothetical protein